MITDEELRRAAAIAEERLLSSLPEPEDCDYEVSGRSHRGMKGIFQRAEHPVLFWVKRGAACFLLVFFIGSAALLTFSTEARAAFINWIRRPYETYNSYTYTGEPVEIDENVKYRPTWLPEGYVESAVYDQKAMVNVEYKKGGEQIGFSYTMAIENATIYIEQEGSEKSTVMVSDISADLYMDNDGGANAIIWINKDNTVVFSIFGHLSEKELIKMAESVELQ